MEETIIKLIKEYSTHEIPLDPCAELIDSGLIDSLCIMNLVSVIEDEFDIELEIQDICKDNFCCVDSMVKMVKSHQR